MRKVSIVKNFGTTELTNRDKLQRDGVFNGRQFREEFLSSYDNAEYWKSKTIEFVEIDFSDVIKLGPSWANEVFAYFTKFAKPERVLEVINPTGLSPVKKAIIELEVTKGYRGKENK